MLKLIARSSPIFGHLKGCTAEHIAQLSNGNLYLLSSKAGIYSGERILGYHFNNVPVRTFSGVTNVQHIVGSPACLCCSSNFKQFRGLKIHSALSAQETEEDILGKGEKVLRLKLPTTRVDAVLKAGLGMSRNKIEKALYDDRVRVNGERPKKKSQSVDEGDEVDIVRGYNKLNPNFIDVSRIEIVEVGDEKDASDSDDEGEESSTKIPVVLRRSKLLTIQNYSPPWKGNVAND